MIIKSGDIIIVTAKNPLRSPNDKYIFQAKDVKSGFISPLEGSIIALTENTSKWKKYPHELLHFTDYFWRVAKVTTESALMNVYLEFNLV